MKMPIPGNLLDFPNIRRSDHRSFWDTGYSAVMITDTANLRNPSYHCALADDALETIDQDFTVGVVRGIAAGVAHALNAP
jgi:hypothetical protein